MGKNTKTIMLIDDNDISLLVVQHQLMNAGIPTNRILMPSGYSSLEYLKANEEKADALPDLIILDINMPIINGWEFLEKFSALKPKLIKNIDVFILSSDTQNIKYIEWKEKNIVKGYFKKPLTFDDVILISNFLTN